MPTIPPPASAIIVSIPGVVGARSRTTASPLSVYAYPGIKIPILLEKLTGVPSGTELPSESNTTALIFVDETPSAQRLTESDITTIECAVIGEK